MKTIFIIFFIAASAIPYAKAQNLDIDPSQRLPEFPAILPGYFHNNLTSTGTEIFGAESYRYNCLRTFEVTWKLRTTAGHAEFISAVQSLRAWHETDAKKTNVLIIQINAMPYWLSSSTDTTRVSSGDNVRYYETVKPGDYARWDSLMRDMASVIKEWNFTPYYELWNEPELYFWNGSETELIELYRHTATAIKSADPAAKIGGFGMNSWHNGIGTSKINTIGYYPDSLADRTATLAHLIDSCAVTGTPLDFISWHAFTIYPRWVEYGYDYFKRKLASRGFARCLQIITEYNAAGSYREQKWHAPYILSLIDLVKSYPLFYHAFASYQDFTNDPLKEFTGDWGSISRSGLIKPVHYALSFLSRMNHIGTTPISVHTDVPVTALATVEGDTIRTLVSNYIVPPQLAGYDVLLFGDAHINTDDLFLAGYHNWEEIDSTFRGLLPPKGGSRIVAAFLAARMAYLHSLANDNQPLDLLLTYRGVNHGANGFICRVDSTNNNMIFRYDSLLALGYTRIQAVNALIKDQSLKTNPVKMQDSTLRLFLPPNGIAYVEIHRNSDPVAVHEAPAPVQILQAFPNPFSGTTTINLTTPFTEVRSLKIYDSLGREVLDLSDQLNRNHQLIIHNYQLPSAGIYFYRLTTGKETQTKMMVFTK